MRWPWKREVRSAGGGYSDAVVAAIEAQAAAKVADASSTAAVEAVAGMLSRAFADAEVIADGWARDAISPFWLMQVGRSLIREGASLSVVSMDGTGALDLVPAAFWNFEALETPAPNARPTGTPASPPTGRRRATRGCWAVTGSCSSVGARRRGPATAGRARCRGRISPPDCRAR